MTDIQNKPDKSYSSLPSIIFILVLLGFVCGAVFYYVRESRIDSIHYVLKQDHELCNTLSSYQYSREMGTIDLSGCPEDLKMAYQAHQKAWIAKVTAEQGIFNFQEKREASKEIAQTWQDVLNIAEKYGVITSKYR